jgi:MFS family permease
MPDRTLTAGERRLSLAAVIGGVFGVGIAFGALVPLLALLLERRGLGGTVIGLNSAMFPVAVLAVGPLLPRIIARLGTLRSMYLGIGSATVLVLLFPVFDSVSAWFVLRFLVGVATGIHWVVSETWMNRLATDRDRGVIMGIYATVLAGGFALGPLLLTVVGIDGALPFIGVAIALALSAVPLALTRRLAPVMPARPAHGLARFVAAAPVVMIGAVVGGLVDNALFTLLPVYGLRVGFEQATAVLLLTVFIGGNLVMQVPLGWLADRTDRRAVLLACVWVALAGTLLLPLLSPGGAFASTALLWPMLFVWGGTAFGIYTISLSLLAERFSRDSMAGANTAFVMSYETGSLSGPVLAGAAIDLAGPNGLIVSVAAVCTAFLLFSHTRRRARLARG